MVHVNEALLLKWSWRFKKDGICLWKKIVVGCHGSNRSWSSIPYSPSSNSCWKFIARVGEKLWNGKPLNSYIRGTVGNGESFHFWIDAWLYDEPLRTIYPQLFIIEKNKWATISDRLQVINGSKHLIWDWSAAPVSAQQVSELFNLLSDIYDFEWKGDTDSWRWTADSSGIYSVKTAKNLLSNGSAATNTWNMNWYGWVPLKCKVMAWRATLNRLPTKIELFKRGVPIQDKACVFCNSDDETAIHIFTGYFYTAEIWTRIQSWCNIAPLIVFDVSDILKSIEAQ